MLVRDRFATFPLRDLAFEILGTDVVEEILEVVDDFGGISFWFGGSVLCFGIHQFVAGKQRCIASD